MLSKTLLAVAALALSPADAIWPIPRSSSTGNGTLWLDHTVSVTYNGEPVSFAPGYTPPAGSDFNSFDIVEGAVSRTLSAIFDNGLQPWMLRARNGHYEPNPSRNGSLIRSLEIVQTEEDTPDTFKPVAGTVDESYTLELTVAGDAHLEAVSSTGVLRGLETFSQLFFKHSDGQHTYTTMAPVSIEDEPKYPHRGLLLDVGRHWFELDDIKRTIDGLAMNKMNVLHLHVTETQSWPLEIPALPKLTESGAYAPHLTYSPEDIDGLYQYAVHRGVQIIMEIDMPGHVGVEEAYPGLTVAFNEHPYQNYCAQPPCGAFKLNDTGVEDFLQTLFDDLLPRLSPYSAYFHTGGDEYKASNSLLDPALETDDLTILQPMLQRFLDHAHGLVRDNGLIPFVWEEMVLEWNATVGEDTVIQSWLGEGAVKELAEGGHKVIDSNNAYYYLDCGRGQWLDFDAATAPMFYPYNDWCSPTKNWRLMYSHEPADGVSDEARENVLGGEVALWTETIDTVSLDTILWPRAGAAAETWWSGRTDAEGKNRTQFDARPRLSEQRERMLARGVRGTPITQLWCDMNNVEDCAHIEQ